MKSQPLFPIYIPSKGRARYGHTMHSLDHMGVPYYIIVDEADYKDYARAFGAKRVLVIDKKYERDYETCDDLGMTKSLGPGPKRNFAWAHAISMKKSHHWVIDDNIRGFFRFNKNLSVPVEDGTIIRCMEDFMLRYENVAMVGPQYFMFMPRKAVHRPFVLNTRIYSCNLIRNDLPFRWRGRYNEDTILSLDVLKGGWCTILFNAFLQDKLATQLVPGGNTEDFYKLEGTMLKSEMLYRVHPDVVDLVKKYGRDHHQVDYSRFRTPLIFKQGAKPRRGANNYGMNLVHKERSVVREISDKMKAAKERLEDSPAKRKK